MFKIWCDSGQLSTLTVNISGTNKEQHYQQQSFPHLTNKNR